MPKIKTIQHFKKVWDYLSISQRRRIVRVTLFSVIAALLDIAGLVSILQFVIVISGQTTGQLGKISSAIFKAVGAYESGDQMLFSACFLFVVFVLKNALSYLIHSWQVHTVYGITKDVSTLKYQHTLQKPFSYYIENNTAKIYHEISSIVFLFSETILLPMLSLIVELSLIILVVMSLFIYDLKLLAILSIVLFPFTLLYVRYKRNKSAKHGSEINTIVPKIHQIIEETSKGFREIKVWNSQQYFTKRIEDKYNALIGHRIAIYKTNYLIPLRMYETIAIGGVLMIVVLGTQFNQVKAIVPLLSLYVSAAFRLLPSMNRISAAITQIAAHEYVVGYLSPRDGSIAQETSKKTDQFSSLQLSNLSFAYSDNELVIKSFSMQLNKGDVLGLQGPSGSGKTTLIHLISGLISPQKGTYTFNNKTITKENRNEIWPYFSILSQSPYLIEGSIMENIAFGEDFKVIDKDKIHNSLALCNLDDWVKSTSDGLSTVLSNNASTISGGQKQRLALARAIYKGADILILDEPTNSLDEDSVNTLHKTINSIKESATIIIISHNPDDLKLCNKIVTLVP